MANRKRLDPELEQQVKAFIAETVAEHGDLSSAQKRAVCEHTDRSERTVERWIGEAKAAHGQRSEVPAVPAGVSSVDAFLRRLPWTFDEEMTRAALAYGGNLAALHRDAVALAANLGLPGPISYGQLTRKFNLELDSDERGFIRKGINGFKAGALYTRWSATHRNQCWQIDATTLDLWVRPKGTDQQLRPEIIVIVDDYSRVVLAAVLLLHGYTADDAAAAVHRAIRLREVELPDGTTTVVGGKPERILCDNAQQFTGELLTSLATRLGFVMWTTAVYAAEQKGKVERLIRSVNEDFAKRLPGYANPELKTLTMVDLLKGLPDHLLDEEQATEELAKWVEEWNHSPHPDYPDRSRYEMWANSNGPVEEVDEELLRPATVLLQPYPYKLSKVGFRVKVGGRPCRYVATAIAGRVGEKFYLQHLPGETDWVDAYDLAGNFVARCWDDTLTEAGKEETAARRWTTYKTLSSLRSEAVELRAAAVASADGDDERPNHLAAAHARATTPAGPALVRASLGLPSNGRSDSNPDSEPTSAHTTSGELPAGDNPSVDTGGEETGDYDAVVAEVLDNEDGQR